jgi:hypothetical protein
VKKVEMGRAKRNAYRVLVGKPEKKRSRGGTCYMQEDNIKIDFKEIGWGGMDWTLLPWDRGQWRILCEHGNEPLGSTKC